MIEKERNRKRMMIIIGIGLVLFGVGTWIVLAVAPTATCFDGKKNQGESGIDCGGVCGECKNIPASGEIQIIEKKLIPTGSGKYDVLLRIKNVSSQFGVSDFKYRIILKDQNGNQIAEKIGKSFLLPAEAKYIVETSVMASPAVSDVGVETNDIVWAEFSDLETPRLSITNKRYANLYSQPLFAAASGILKNESGSSFGKVKITAVLRDAENRAIAVNSAEINSIISGEEREFRLTWPTEFSGSVQNLEMEATTNVFEPFNLLKNEIPELPFRGYR